MTATVVYLVLASIWLGLFHILYRLVLKPVPSPNINRILLLTGLFLTFLIPLLRIEIFPEDNHPVRTITNASGVDLSNMPLAAPSILTWSPPIQAPSWSVSQIIFMLWIAGCALATGLLAYKLLTLFRLVHTSQSVTNAPNNNYLFNPRFPKASNFSHYIFWYRPDYDPRDASIAEHEQFHQRLGHGMDNLLFSLARIFLWFHPSIYQLHREIQLVHELQVDGRILQHVAPADYFNQLAKYHRTKYRPMANGFASYLEQRIRYIVGKDRHPRLQKMQIISAIGLANLMIIFSAYNNKSIGNLVSGWSERPLFALNLSQSSYTGSEFILEFGEVQIPLEASLGSIDFNDEDTKLRNKQGLSWLLTLTNPNKLTSPLTLKSILTTPPVLHYKNKIYRYHSGYQYAFATLYQYIGDSTKYINKLINSQRNYPILSNMIEALEKDPDIKTAFTLNLSAKNYQVNIHLETNIADEDQPAYLNMGDTKIPFHLPGKGIFTGDPQPIEPFLDQKMDVRLVRNDDTFSVTSQTWIVFYPDTIIQYQGYPRSQFANSIGCIAEFRTSEGTFYSSFPFQSTGRSKPVTLLESNNILRELNNPFLTIMPPVLIQIKNGPLRMEWGKLNFCLDFTCRYGDYHIKPKEFEKMLGKIPVLSRDRRMTADSLFLDLYHIRRHEVPVNHHLVYDLKHKKLVSGKEGLEAMKSQYLLDEFFDISRVAIHKNGKSLGEGGFHISLSRNGITPYPMTDPEQLKEVIDKVFN